MSFSVPAWLIPIIQNALVNAGKAAARALCQKYLGDPNCGSTGFGF